MQITFNGTQTITEIDVFTVQDNRGAPVEPTSLMVIRQWGITSFYVQYWNGSGWAFVPGGTVFNNTLVWRKFTFAPITTDRIRVQVSAAQSLLGGNYSRITELQAWTALTPPTNLPPAVSINSPASMQSSSRHQQDAPLAGETVPAAWSVDFPGRGTLIGTQPAPYSNAASIAGARTSSGHAPINSPSTTPPPAAFRSTCRRRSAPPR